MRLCRRQRPAGSHNSPQLLLAEPIAEVAPEELVDLSKLAADSRYPGDAPQPGRADAESTVAVARLVLADATRRFGGGG